MINVEEYLRRKFPLWGWHDGIQTLVTIEFISGFELFNNRPYHCYETWCQGWRVTNVISGKKAERESLEDALKAVFND